MNTDLGRSIYLHVPLGNTGELQNCAIPLIEHQLKCSPNWNKVDFYNARLQTSEQQLKMHLEKGVHASDIVVQRSLSNCLAYNFDNVDGAIMDTELAQRRKRLDAQLKLFAKKCFEGDFSCENTGHFWYPPGAYMSWHTNIRTPGWRLYLTHAKQPGKSFFRFRDPSGGEIHTSWDQTWDIRIFNVTHETPLWHCVYSETDRFSFGYKITPVGSQISALIGGPHLEKY